MKIDKCFSKKISCQNYQNIQSLLVVTQDPVSTPTEKMHFTFVCFTFFFEKQYTWIRSNLFQSCLIWCHAISQNEQKLLRREPQNIYAESVKSTTIVDKPLTVHTIHTYHVSISPYSQLYFDRFKEPYLLLHDVYDAEWEGLSCQTLWSSHSRRCSIQLSNDLHSPYAGFEHTGRNYIPQQH